MRAMTAGILGVLLLASLAGCIRLKSRPVYGFAPIVQMDDNYSWPIETWDEEAKAEYKRPPKEPAPLQAEADFIAAKPGCLQELGVRLDRPFQILSDRERSKILSEAMSSAPPLKPAPNPWEGRPSLSAGRLPPIRLEAQPSVPGGKLFFQRVMKFPVYPLRLTNVEVKTGFQYAGEADTGQEKPLDSLLLSVSDGTVLKLRVEVDGGAFVVTRIEPKVVAYLGSRSVTARAEVNGKEREIFWQEPAVLEGVGQVSSPCQIRLNPGESILLPLRHTLRLGKAASRSLAQPGTIREQFDAGTRDLRHPDPRGYPLRNDAFVLFSLKFAQPKEPPK